MARECLKMNVRSKLCPDSAVTQGSSQSLERPCSCHSEGAKPCQDGTVTWECSSMNVDTEKKLRTSSVKFLDTSLDLDLPGPKKINKPSYPAGQLEMHQVGTTNLKRPKTNVKKEMKHQVLSNSPWDWGEVVITHPLLPSWEVWWETHIAKMHVGLEHNSTTLVGSENERVDMTIVLRQLEVSDLGHKSQWLCQQSKHKTHDSPHAKQQSCQRSIQWKTRDSSHTSQVFQHGLRVPHSTSTMRHHLQGRVVLTST